MLIININRTGNSVRNKFLFCIIRKDKTINTIDGTRICYDNYDLIR
jgi:hypothetical protein